MILVKKMLESTFLECLDVIEINVRMSESDFDMYGKVCT